MIKEWEINVTLQGCTMAKNGTKIIDENTPLLVLAGPMFLELLLNTMLHNIDTVMLSHFELPPPSMTEVDSCFSHPGYYLKQEISW